MDYKKATDELPRELTKDCQESAAYNDRCMQQYPNQRPADWVEPAPIEYHKPTKPIEAVQLSLFD